MNGKFLKYWLNFGLLTVVVSILLLPLVPYAKYRPPVKPDVQNVLGVGKSKPSFSDIIFSDVVEASFSARETERVINPLTVVRNDGPEKKSYKVVVRGEGDGGNSFGYFTINGEEEAVLLSGQSSEVILILGRSGNETGRRFVVSVLVSL